MSVHDVKATHEYLRKVASTREPVKALSEFVWNALDADATKVTVDFVRNGLGGIERIEIRDNGTGITKARADRDFTNIGDSWKLSLNRTAVEKRAIHGKEGRGRLRFFSLARWATWKTVYAEQDKRLGLEIKIDGDSLNRADVPEPSDVENNDTGTNVALEGLKETFDWIIGEEARAEFDAIFAPYLLQYPNVQIVYDGAPVDPSVTIERSVELPTKPVVCPGGAVVKDLALKVIEWRTKSESRKIYFGGKSGIVLGSQAAGVSAPRFDFSVYASSPFFEEIAKANLLEFDNLSDPAFATVVRLRTR